MPIPDQTTTRFVRFDEQTVDTHEIVPFVGDGSTIKVKCLHLFSVGINQVDIQSGPTVLAAYPLTANVQVLLPLIQGAGQYFETVEGEPLNIRLSAALRMTGFVIFEQN